MCGTSAWFSTEVEYVDCGEGGGGEEYFSVYPNPSSNALTISLNTSSKINLEVSAVQKSLQPPTHYKVELFNFSGKPVWSSLVGDNEFPYSVNTSEVKNGLYILKITHNNRVESKRIEIQK